jgi:hypothetical protein
MRRGRTRPPRRRPPMLYTAPKVTLIARPQFVEPEHLPIAWKG